MFKDIDPNTKGLLPRLDNEPGPATDTDSAYEKCIKYWNEAKTTSEKDKALKYIGIVLGKLTKFVQYSLCAIN